jgi:heme-degrading monooxygenase HmoA
MARGLESVEQRVAAADTVEKVWELIEELAHDANGYSDSTYLQNIKDYARVAADVHSHWDGRN